MSAVTMAYGVENILALAVILPCSYDEPATHAEWQGVWLEWRLSQMPVFKRGSVSTAYSVHPFSGLFADLELWNRLSRVSRVCEQMTTALQVWRDVLAVVRKDERFKILTLEEAWRARFAIWAVDGLDLSAKAGVTKVIV